MGVVLWEDEQERWMGSGMGGFGEGGKGVVGMGNMKQRGEMWNALDDV